MSNYYRSYINSRRWRIKREAYWNSNRPKSCYKCSKRRTKYTTLELHHLTYERLGKEKLTDLVPLCHACHEIITKAWRAERHKPDALTLRQLTDKICKKGIYSKTKYVNRQRNRRGKR